MTSNLPVTSSTTITSIGKKMSILSSYGYSPEENELDNYDNVSYHLTLSMMSTSQTVNKIIIAESGATEMNIQSFQMQQTISPNQSTRNIGTNVMTMEIYNPFSVDFFDKLRLAASSLYIPDATKCIFLIEISFKGYDPITGIANTNIYGTASIKCLMLDIDTTIDSSGSRFSIEFVELVDQGSMDEYMVIDRSQIIQSASGTLGDILNNFALMLSQTNRDNHYGIPMTTYKFDYENYSSEDIKDGIVSPKDLIVKINNSDTTQPQRNPDDISAPKSVSIQNIIEQLLSNSPTATKLLGNVDPITRQADAQFIKGIGHKIVISVQYGAWVELFRSYEKIITYKIVPFKVFHILNSPDNIKNYTSNNQLCMDKFRQICQSNSLKKEYNYQFTGENTEVLNFDIKTKSNFSYIFLPATGTSTYSQNTSTPKWQADNKKLTDLVRQKEILNQDIAANNEAISKETDQTKLSSLTSTAQKNAASLQSLNEQILVASGEVQKDAETNQTIMDTLLSKQSSVRYIDDIENNTSSKEYDEIIPSSILTNNVDTVGFSGIIEEKKDYGQSIYSTLLSQYYGSGTDALQNITIDIRLDPYWITNKNANEAKQSSSQVISLQNIDYGTQEFFKDQFAHFIINFNIADGVDETTGNIKLNYSDTYSGIYQVITVTSHFSGGAMYQTLDAVKLNVLTLGRILGGANSSTSIGGNANTTSISSSSPISSLTSSSIENNTKTFASNIKNKIDSSMTNPKTILGNIISSTQTSSKTSTPINRK